MRGCFMLKPMDVYPKEVYKALDLSGKYIYAYYDIKSYTPFYIGKGVGRRVLDHWNNAISNPKKPHEKKIFEILKNRNYPQIKLLAYNLDSKKEESYSIAERVLQDAFGIQSVWFKKDGIERLDKIPAILLQTREDSAKSPCLTLDALLGMHNIRGTLKKFDIQEISNSSKSPILLVGLSKTYHSSYSSNLLAEMARMYWNLENFSNTTLPILLNERSTLIAWSSKINRKPMIIGAWKINNKKPRFHRDFNRYEFYAQDDNKIRSLFVGMQLEGTGNNWQGPKIYVPG